MSANLLEAARDACAEAGIPVSVVGKLAVEIEEAADLLGVSRSTVKRLIDRGEIVPFRIGRAVRIELTELCEFIGRNRVSKTDSPRGQVRARALELLDGGRE